MRTMKVKPSLVAVSTAMILFGCGGGDESSSHEEPVVLSEAPVSASDAFTVVTPAERHYVDLAPFVASGGQGAVVSEVSLLSTHNDECGAPTADGLGFYAQIEGAVCDYTYTVRSIPSAHEVATTSEAKIAVMGTVNPDPYLPAISHTMLTDDPDYVINLHNELGGEYATFALQDPVEVYGPGNVTSDLTNDIITFDPVQAGSTRIVYYFEDSANPGDIRVGTIDIAVSDTPNLSIDANKVIDYTEQTPEVGQTIEIDVFDYVVDHDLEGFQLVEVRSLTADVEIVDKSNMSNSKFNFWAPKAGVHDVSFVVSDHQGGFDLGLMKVTVVDPRQDAEWTSIVGSDGQTYTAPFTKTEAEDRMVDFSANYDDNGYSPEIAMPLYTSEEAQTLCNAVGRLPTETELNTLATNDDPQGTHNWPAEEPYWAASGPVPTMTQSDLTLGVTEATTHTYGSVTCVENTYLTHVTADTEAVANNYDEVSITVKLVDATGSPLSGQSISITTDTANPSHVAIDVTQPDGTLTFTATSTVAEEVVFTLTDTTSGSGESLQVTANYAADPTTARISESMLQKTDAIPISHLVTAPTAPWNLNKISFKITDDFGNPVPGQRVDFSADTPPGLIRFSHNSTYSDQDGKATAQFAHLASRTVTITANLDSPVSQAANSRAQVITTKDTPVFTTADGKYQVLPPQTAEGVYGEAFPGAGYITPESEPWASYPLIHDPAQPTTPAGMRSNVQFNNICQSVSRYGSNDWFNPSEPEVIDMGEGQPAWQVWFDAFTNFAATEGIDLETVEGEGSLHGRGTIEVRDGVEDPVHLENNIVTYGGSGGLEESGKGHTLITYTYPGVKIVEPIMSWNKTIGSSFAPTFQKAITPLCYRRVLP